MAGDCCRKFSSVSSRADTLRVVIGFFWQDATRISGCVMVISIASFKIAHEPLAFGDYAIMRTFHIERTHARRYTIFLSVLRSSTDEGA